MLKIKNFISGDEKLNILKNIFYLKNNSSNKNKASKNYFLIENTHCVKNVGKIK